MQLQRSSTSTSQKMGNPSGGRIRMRRSLSVSVRCWQWTQRVRLLMSAGTSRMTRRSDAGVLDESMHGQAVETALQAEGEGPGVTAPQQHATQGQPVAQAAATLPAPSHRESRTPDAGAQLRPFSAARVGSRAAAATKPARAIPVRSSQHLGVAHPTRASAAEGPYQWRSSCRRLFKWTRLQQSLQLEASTRRQEHSSAQHSSDAACRWAGACQPRRCRQGIRQACGDNQPTVRCVVVPQLQGEAGSQSGFSFLLQSPGVVLYDRNRTPALRMLKCARHVMIRVGAASAGCGCSAFA